LRNKSIFQISTLICLSSISICNLLIDLPSYLYSPICPYGVVTDLSTVTLPFTWKEDLGASGNIKMDLRGKGERVWTECVCLRIMSRGVLLLTWK
jgi:hypothetical protein